MAFKPVPTVDGGATGTGNWNSNNGIFSVINPPKSTLSTNTTYVNKPVAPIAPIDPWGIPNKTVSTTNTTNTVSGTPSKVVTSNNPSGSTGGGGSGSGGTSSADAKQKAIEQYLAGSRDAYYNTQAGMLGKQQQQQIAEIQKAYQDAVDAGNLSITEANDQFTKAVNQINTQAYRDSQLTQAYGFDRGIGNSQQLLGLMAGDNSRKQTMVNDVTTQRDTRINALKDRISKLTTQKDLDITNANNDYNYNLSIARGQADQNYNDAMTQLKMQDWQNAVQAQQDALNYQRSKAGDYSVDGGKDISINDIPNSLLLAMQDYYSQQAVNSYNPTKMVTGAKQTDPKPIF
jgi:hypothetical protein